MIGDNKKKKEKKFSPFKSEAEERAWRHAHMLTVGKLVAWLQQYDQDALVYAVESNTNTWQEIPEDFEQIGYVFSTLETQKRRELDNLMHWYKGSKDGEKKARDAYEDAFQYTEDKGICVIG